MNEAVLFEQSEQVVYFNTHLHHQRALFAVKYLFSNVMVNVHSILQQKCVHGSSVPRARKKKLQD